MSGSYEKIDYRMRPAKATERRMLCDAFGRLKHFAPVDSYRYVGFGSTYFADFILFHKQHGFCNMISIEEDARKKARFEFNKPYECVTLQFGPASRVLPRLSWSDRSIVWLDYDDKLCTESLGDIATVALEVASGSIVLVSVNVRSTGSGADRLSAFRSRLGNRASPRLQPSDFEGEQGWAEAKPTYDVICGEITLALASRNAGKAPDQQVTYEQLFRFHYSDGANMLTVGGIFVNPAERDTLCACQFEALPFIVLAGHQPFQIYAPKLTLREIRELERFLPNGDERRVLEGICVPADDEFAFRNIYRYFPTFAEVEIG